MKPPSCRAQNIFCSAFKGQVTQQDLLWSIFKAACLMHNAGLANTRLSLRAARCEGVHRLACNGSSIMRALLATGSIMMIGQRVCSSRCSGHRSQHRRR